MRAGGEERVNWSFAEVAEEAAVQKPHFSFPTWFWDYDQDGFLDLFACSYSMERYSRFVEDVTAHYLGLPVQTEVPRLYRNRGDGTFEDVTGAVGLDQPLFAMGSNFGDLDNDGFPDMYLGTGEPELQSIIPNRMFRNDHGLRFLDVTTAGGFGHLQKGHGVAFGDIDNDGDQDIYAVLGGAYEGDVYQNSLFLNPGAGHHWITLILEGRKTNRSAIGARIRVRVQSDRGPREIHTTVSTGGSFGSSSLRQEIGLGDATAVDWLEVRWPGSGLVQSFEAVKLNETYRLLEGETALTPVPLRTLTLRKH